MKKIKSEDVHDATGYAGHGIENEQYDRVYQSLAEVINEHEARKVELPNQSTIYANKSWTLIVTQPRLYLSMTKIMF